MHETTINIDIDLLAYLKEIACCKGVTLNQCIHFYLMTIIGNNLNSKIKENLISYQDSQHKDRWKKVHLYLDASMYEFFLDARKVLKCSISKLLALAVALYKEESAVIVPQLFYFISKIFDEGVLSLVINAEVKSLGGTSFLNNSP